MDQRLVPMIIGILTFASTACSIGKITDATNGQALEHAKVTFQSWDTSTRLEYLNGGLIPPGYQPSFSLNATSTTWANSDPGANGRAGFWYLNPYAPLNPGDTTVTHVLPGWNRIKVEKPGYTTRWVYRDHEYTNWGAQVYTTSAYSAGPYPATMTSAIADDQTAYAEENFTLYPSSLTTRHRAPDVMVDPRTLLDCEISDLAGAPPASINTPTHDCEGAVNPVTGAPVTRCLRYSVGTPNVGEGDLWLKSLDGGQTVTQYVYTQPYPDATTVDSVSVPGGQIIYHPEHMHFHFKDWTTTRLRANSTNCEANPSSCPLTQTTGTKTSFCLEDYRYQVGNPTGTTFDSTYQARRYQPDTCGLEQGIGAGRMDTYRRVLPDQMIDISGLAPGDYWLEVEVDAAHFIEESDYTNNVSRVRITIPAVGTSPSTWQCYGCTQLGSGQWSCTNKDGTVVQ